VNADKIITIIKPDGTNAEFNFSSTNKQVIYTESGAGGETVTYENIVGFYFNKLGEVGAENGAEVEVKAQLNNNNYSLKNIYYTRNMKIS
jgi:hypothetical protein